MLEDGKAAEVVAFVRALQGQKEVEGEVHCMFRAQFVEEIRLPLVHLREDLVDSGIKSRGLLLYLYAKGLPVPGMYE